MPSRFPHLQNDPEFNGYKYWFKEEEAENKQRAEPKSKGPSKKAQRDDAAVAAQMQKQYDAMPEKFDRRVLLQQSFGVAHQIHATHAHMMAAYHRSICGMSHVRRTHYMLHVALGNVFARDSAERLRGLEI